MSDPSILRIPKLSLVVLIGPSGSGKSTFAARHFLPTEVLSSDRFRGLVADDENDQAATKDAFELLHAVAAKRLALGRLTVVDATNVQPEARKPLVELARAHHVLPVAIVFDLPERLCRERNRGRPDRDFGAHVIRNQRSQLRRSLGRLDREGFRRVAVFRTPEEVDGATIEREPSWSDRTDLRGPFDIVGDVHGCAAELRELLAKLGWEVDEEGAAARHPEGRTAVFLGDLVDRGPDTPGVLRLVMNMVERGVALCVPGNHENKLVRARRGRNVQVSHGLAESLAQLEREAPEFAERAVAFLDGLVSHYVLDEGRLVVAHAGMKREMQGRASAAVRSFALYGETTGETDEYGLPVRYPWALDYRGPARVVYGHTPVPEPEWINKTICIDTGCVFGGKLTALRYPELELVAVPAHRTYYEPAKPFLPEGEAAPPVEAPRPWDLLDVDDVLGKRIVQTGLQGSVTIREENAAAALEVMSRFAADPRWVVYLPPTMSPPDTTKREGLLEHPDEAFAYFRSQGVDRVMCQEKHMGSRAVVVLGRDAEAARRRFGITNAAGGVCLTRTGRRFFADRELERELLERVRGAVARAGLWDELSTDWLVLDGELMPWSVKAEELLREQYAPVGAAATRDLAAADAVLQAALSRGLDVAALAERAAARTSMVRGYVDACGRYVWPVAGVEDLQLAPFHVLASEGRVHLGRDHGWHMSVLARLAQAGEPVVHPTRHLVVDVTDPSSVEAGARWWEELTAGGAEGMVVKPFEGIARSKRNLVQPGVKVRGPQYLRIVYGPEYTEPANLDRLRQRSVGLKRSLAAREFALGVEALERLVRREPLYRVHECVFGILALESEPVDPAL
jgi:protein phosphatase